MRHSVAGVPPVVGTAEAWRGKYFSDTYLFPYLFNPIITELEKREFQGVTLTLTLNVVTANETAS